MSLPLIASALGLLSVFVSIRNYCVFTTLEWFAKHESDRHDTLPSYHTMLFNPKFILLWTPQHWLAWLNRQQEGGAA